MSATIVDMASDAVDACPLSAQDAAALAGFYAGYAHDRIRGESDRPPELRRLFHPGVGTHLGVAETQLRAAREHLEDPRGMKLHLTSARAHLVAVLELLGQDQERVDE